ncbi:MAG: outer membrane protein OmpU [Paracoccaceae bacterium]|jgi:outer membrane protein OmpU
MKNALFATTALVAFGFAGAASAAEPLKASVGGYMNIGVGITDNAGGDDVLIMRDGEIVVKFKGSSDNGLTFDGRFELEAFGSSDQVDENWARVSGSFGEIKIGGDDTAMNSLSAGVFYGPGAVIGYYDEIAPSTLASFGKQYGTDYLAVHYNTPNFSGFQAGFTYAPDGTSDGAADGTFAVNDGADGSNVYSIGVNYTGEVQGVSLSLSGGYTDADGSDQEAWSLGAEVGVTGVKLGVHYEENRGADAGSDLAVGITYATGPWTATAGYATLLDAPANSEIQKVAGWVTYAIAPGVKGVAGVSFADSDASGEQYLGMAYLNLGF